MAANNGMNQIIPVGQNAANPANGANEGNAHAGQGQAGQEAAEIQQVRREEDHEAESGEFCSSSTLYHTQLSPLSSFVLPIQNREGKKIHLLVSA
ncbi:hypothetical protein FRC17_003322 [Serendipita sp. 399]|nr:hypothetical protein FRC17_003322 [Serendipita sp. 399]